MAEFPTIDLNSQLIGRGLNTTNPANTYVDFATQLAKNQQEQAQMEQNIARAKELTKQSQIQTGQEEQAQAAGVNPLTINTMSPKQANTYAKALLEAKGLLDDKQSAAIDTWTASLTGPIRSEVASEFANRLSGERIKLGTGTELTTDQEITIPEGSSAAKMGLQDAFKVLDGGKQESVDDNEISDGTYVAHVPHDGMYQVARDNRGTPVSYSEGGKEAVEPVAKPNTANARAWNQFVQQMDPYTASGRNSIGVAMQSFVRATRATNTLKGEVTQQQAANIVAEIGAIYKGGSPDQSLLQATYYPTIYGTFKEMIQKASGTPQEALPPKIKAYLLDQIGELNNVTKQTIKNHILLAEKSHTDLISAHKDEWNDFKETLFDQLDDPMKADVSKLPGNPSSSTPDTTVIPDTATPVNPSVQTGVRTSPGGHSYRVGG